MTALVEFLLWGAAVSVVFVLSAVVVGTWVYLVLSTLAFLTSDR